MMDRVCSACALSMQCGACVVVLFATLGGAWELLLNSMMPVFDHIDMLTMWSNGIVQQLSTHMHEVMPLCISTADT